MKTVGLAKAVNKPNIAQASVYLCDGQICMPHRGQQTEHCLVVMLCGDSSNIVLLFYNKLLRYNCAQLL